MPNDILFLIAIFVLSLWTLFWKIFSVWTAARNGDRGWFVVLLLLNTLGILDIWYIFNVAKVPKERIKQILKRPVKKLFSKSIPNVKSEEQKEEERAV